MSHDFFMNQMRRLNTQWKNSYGEERTKRLWQIWKNCDDLLFSDIVDRALDTFRAAPLTDDFAKIEQEVRSQRAKFREYDGLSEAGGLGGILEKAYNPALYSDEQTRARIKGRIALVNDFSMGRITKKQFDEGCDFYNKAGNIRL